MEGIFSVSSPGVPITGTGEEGRKLTRELNTYLGNLSSTSTGPHAGKFGFFGVLPDWNDVDGVLAEIEFLYTEQKLCSGVGIYTSYGGKLPGHPSFKPIWQRLQAHKALVHMHPTNVDVQPRFIGGFLPQPIIDYPQDTTRAAVDLVVTGTVRSCPDVDIILSHAGGTLPFLATRALGSLEIPPIVARAGVDSAAQAVEDMGRYYYDIALSTSPAQLGALLEVTDPSHVLYGSDYPYAPAPAILKVQGLYERFVATNPKGESIKPAVLRENANRLLNKHSLGQVYGEESTPEQKL